MVQKWVRPKIFFVGPGLALVEEVMNPGQLSDQDRSVIDNRAMDFGIGPGIFVKLLKSDRFYLDEKRQQQEEELELATMNVDKSHGSRGRRRRRREKRIKNRIINELPSYAQKPTEGKKLATKFSNKKIVKN